MNTNRWGPSMWTSIHAICFNYPKEPSPADKARYRKYFQSLSDILPCKYCRDSFKQFLKEIPMEPYLGDREGMIYWSYRIHDRVNRKLEKRSIPFEAYVRTYEDMRAKCSKRDGTHGTCLEPMKNFTSSDEISVYAQSIWKKYHTGDAVTAVPRCQMADPSTLSTTLLSAAALLWIGAVALLG